MQLLRNTSLNSFNFDLSKKRDSKSNEEKVRDALIPKNQLDIKLKLKNGGKYVLSAPDRDRLIEIPETFLTSKKLPTVKFTNFINLDSVPESTRRTLKTIIDDITYICENNEMVEFAKNNTSHLRSVLKSYGIDDVLSEDNETIFKVDGISYYESGKKENPFRIYMKIDGLNQKQTKYKLIFCDVYHLCIATGYKGLSSFQMREQTYLKYCYSCKNHLKELIEI
jgi:hypothetical protein